MVLTAASIALVRLVAACHRGLLPEDWLRCSLREPFQPPFGWATWALVGTCAAPLAALAASLPLYLLPDALKGGVGTVDGMSTVTEGQDIRVFAMLAMNEGTHPLACGPRTLRSHAPPSFAPCPHTPEHPRCRPAIARKC